MLMANTNPQRFEIVLAWLQTRSISGTREQQGDTNFDGWNEIDELTEDDNIVDENEETRNPNEFFPHMTQASQYEISRQLQENYQSIEQQWTEQELNKEEEETISNFDNITNNTCDSSYCWFLSSVSSSEPSQPSRTDSEVYALSVEEQDIMNEQSQEIMNENSVIAVAYDVENSSAQQQPCEQNEIGTQTLPNVLHDNLLLRACILDINNIPMTGPLVLLVNNMHEFIFNEEEITILRHFVRYKIRLEINEINQRINNDLLQEHDRINEEQSVENNLLVVETPNSRHNEEGYLFRNLSSILESPEEGEDVEIIISDIHNVSVDNVEIVEVKTYDISLAVDEPSRKTHESQAIIIPATAQDLVCNGHTQRVLEIMDNMTQLRYRERQALLRQRKTELSAEEIQVIHNFIETAEDHARLYRPAGFWRRLRQRFLNLRQREVHQQQQQRTSIWHCCFSCWTIK